MPFEFLEDGVTSDVTFRASGKTLDEAFAAAAEATTNVMVASLDSVRPETLVAVSEEAEELDLLLVRFLEVIIFRKDADGLLLRPRRVHVHATGGRHQLEAELHGEALDSARHELLADVKAVTLHRLHVARTDAGWEAEVTLDV